MSGYEILRHGTRASTKGHIWELGVGWVMLEKQACAGVGRSTESTIMSGGNEQDDGVVETGHSVVQKVTGMSMLSCSIRWARTLQQES